MPIETRGRGKKKKEGKILRHQSKFLFYERESCAKLPTTIRLELTRIFIYRIDYLLEIHTINQILNTINIRMAITSLILKRNDTS